MAYFIQGLTGNLINILNIQSVYIDDNKDTDVVILMSNGQTLTEKLNNSDEAIVRRDTIINALLSAGSGEGGSSGGSTILVDSALSSTSTNPVQNKIIKAALDEKANTTDIIDEISVGELEPTSDNWKLWVDTSVDNYGWKLISEYTSEADGDINIEFDEEYQEIDIEFTIPANQVSEGELLYYFNGSNTANKTRTSIVVDKDFYGIITGKAKHGIIEGISQLTNNNTVYDGDILRWRDTIGSSITSIRLHLWSGVLPAGTVLTIYGRK